MEESNHKVGVQLVELNPVVCLEIWGVRWLHSVEILHYSWLTVLFCDTIVTGFEY